LQRPKKLPAEQAIRLLTAPESLRALRAHHQLFWFANLRYQSAGHWLLSRHVARPDLLGGDLLIHLIATYSDVPAGCNNGSVDRVDDIGVDTNNSYRQH
jgi:hypothetical protein